MTFAEAIELTKAAYAMLSCPGETEVPERHIVELPAGRLTVMTGAARRGQEAGAKLLTVFPANVARGLPRINALVIVLDTETGLVDTVLDGTWMTAFRTGAACGASVDLLALPEAAVMVVFGAGPVGRMSALAAASVRPIKVIRVCDPDRARGEALVRELKAEMGSTSERDVEYVADPSVAVKGAKVVITATNASVPLFPDTVVGPGVHIAGMGGGWPNHELEPSTVRKARVFVDARDTAARECGDLRKAWGPCGPEALPIAGEIGEVVLGQLDGRTTSREITLFESCGSAVQDVVIGSELARRARATGVGNDVGAVHGAA
jgi:ornithine cyclodeaminase